jgi:hypothetical protein
VWFGSFDEGAGTGPPLVLAEKTAYRLRVHCRGRDTNRRLLVEEPSESYYLQLWPGTATDATEWKHCEVARLGPQPPHQAVPNEPCGSTPPRPAREHPRQPLTSATSGPLQRRVSGHRHRAGRGCRPRTGGSAQASPRPPVTAPRRGGTAAIAHPARVRPGRPSPAS